MEPQRHAPRRTPDQPSAPLDLQQAADELLAEARTLSSGRSARTLTPGAGAVQKSSLLAITAGETLQEHVAPGPTTLYGVRGRCTVTDHEGSVTLLEGSWMVCPTHEHTVEAETDTVLLLTVTAADDPTD